MKPIITLLLTGGLVLAASADLLIEETVAQAPSSSGATTIRWDEGTLTLVQAGALYGRMIRLQNGDILCSYESRGKSWVRLSRDNGKSWQHAILVQEMTCAAAANPELLRLKNGRVLLFYNQRPRDGVHPFAVGYCFSDDNGKTWQRPDKLIYEAAPQAGQGCWEPAAIQLASGEIQLFFANEFPYKANDDQEITLMRSFDNGATWKSPETVCYRKGHRDGMPVPLVLQDGKGIVLAIEDNGLSPGNQLQPAIIRTSMAANWKQAVISGDSAQRWSALNPPLPVGRYGGAPYLRQLLGGAMILSFQEAENNTVKPKMVVCIGDKEAHNFASPSLPFGRYVDAGQAWNSLFLKDAQTITALSSTQIKGIRGLWAIDGHVN